MAFPDKKSRQYLPKGFKHVFLIREPHKLFTSYMKAMYQHLTNVGIRSGDAADEGAFDIGHGDPVMNANEFYSGITELWNYVRDNLDPNPIVINTDDLLANPAEVLQKLCDLTGLPYSDSLLHWDASPDVINNWIRGEESKTGRGLPERKRMGDSNGDRGEIKRGLGAGGVYRHTGNGLKEKEREEANRNDKEKNPKMRRRE
nr:uncharacterized protein LOC129279573 [Lytechinus pictus]